MAAPSYSDYTIYTGTKLTNTDWNTNLQITVNYLTDGTADLTIGDLVCGAITGVGNVGITGDITASGSISGTYTGSGAALTNVTPADNTVATAKLQNGAVTVIKTTGNIAVTSLSDDFTVTQVSTGYAIRTGARVTITTTKASGSVLLHVTSAWDHNGTSSLSALYLRINRDSGTEYKNLASGSRTDPATGPVYVYGTGTLLFTSLSAGAHTFDLEFATTTFGGATSITSNKCSNASYLEPCVLIAQEV